MSATVPCARERVKDELLLLPVRSSKEVFKERALFFLQNTPTRRAESEHIASTAERFCVYVGSF